jgi:hypothetical protein
MPSAGDIVICSAYVACRLQKGFAALAVTTLAREPAADDRAIGWLPTQHDQLIVEFAAHKKLPVLRGLDFTWPTGVTHENLRGI